MVIDSAAMFFVQPHAWAINRCDHFVNLDTLYCPNQFPIFGEQDGPDVEFLTTPAALLAYEGIHSSHKAK